MIHIEEKRDCCGCESCVQACPRCCISMREDKEGFLYPEVDRDLCVDCHLCERVCPVLNQGEERRPSRVYAAKNKEEEVRRRSSSGGIFTLLAERVIAEDGVVFGARFDECWRVVHGYTETREGLSAFRGSKYVQSRIGDSYRQAEAFLKSGRKVLFSGTPCQIAGLRLYLRKAYENLLTVDFICHGVPSPGVWREYLREEIARQRAGKNSVLSHPNRDQGDICVANISFRDKRLGWKKFSFALTLSVPDGHGAKNTVLLSEPLDKNVYLRGFLSDLYLRPSCYACPAKCLKSGSDVTIGDFWGIRRVFPDFDDDKGVSVLLIHTDHAFVTSLLSSMETRECTYEEACQPSLIRSSLRPGNRDSFFLFPELSLRERVRRFERKRPSLLRRIVNKIYRIVQS